MVVHLFGDDLLQHCMSVFVLQRGEKEMPSAACNLQSMSNETSSFCHYLCPIIRPLRRRRAEDEQTQTQQQLYLVLPRLLLLIALRSTGAS